MIMSIFIMNNGEAQTNNRKTTVTGTVMTSSGVPVEGATFFIDGSRINSRSDRDGKFKIRVKNNVKTITVFSLNNGAAEKEFNGQDTINFVLGNNAVGIRLPEEEVGEKVDIGYESVRKKDLSTSVGSVNEEKY